MLEMQEYGGGDGTPLVIAHGLFGSGRNWGVIAKRLSAQRRVITVDMRNHAGSFWDADHSYPALAADLAKVLTPLGDADLLGHSMGGKAAMVAALAGAPIRRLIIADIAPVAYGHTQLPLVEAMRALPLEGLETRGQANAALSETVPDDTTRAFLLQSLDLRARRWRLNLDALADQMPLILGFPEVSGSFTRPALFLSGAESDYVQPEARPIIRGLFPASRFAKIPNAGHWLHAEAPRAFGETVSYFLDADL